LTAQVTAYALDTVQQRGRLFVKPGEQVYEGQVVGIYQRSGDLKVRVWLPSSDEGCGSICACFREVVLRFFNSLFHPS
jgi:hypothetical protein